MIVYLTESKANRGVAQSGSAPEWGSGGRRFESGHPDFEANPFSKGHPPSRENRKQSAERRREVQHQATGRTISQNLHYPHRSCQEA